VGCRRCGGEEGGIEVVGCGGRGRGVPGDCVESEGECGGEWINRFFCEAKRRKLQKARKLM